MSSSRRWFDVRMEGNEADIFLFGAIGASFFDDDAVSASDFVKEFNAVVDGVPGNIRLHVNSFGGNVFDGMAIYNTIHRVRDRVVALVEGSAFSIASVIVLAAREVVMGAGSMMMIHEASGGDFGTSTELRKTADILDKITGQIADIYADKIGKDGAEVLAAMKAVSFFTSDEAVEFGLADRVDGEMALPAVALADMAVWSQAYMRGDNPLAGIRTARGNGAGAQNEEDIVMAGSTGSGTVAPPAEPVAATLAEIEAACPDADSDFMVAQMKLSATKESAARAWNAELSKRLTASEEGRVSAEKARDEAIANASKSGGSGDGLGALNAGTGGAGDSDEAGDAVAQFEAAVGTKMDKFKMERIKAVQAVCSENPMLHQAFLLATNSGSRVQRLIGEKYE